MWCPGSASSKIPNQVTPKKNGVKNGPMKNKDDECFGDGIEVILDTDFDFEGNLALFDKAAVFEEIDTFERRNGTRSRGTPNEKPTRYRHDENILESEPIVYRQITVPQHSGKEYCTDSGLVVPSISYYLHKRLLAAAERYGLSLERRLEMTGVCASQMTLTLLGGPNRLNPKNVHQRPTVALLCGPHVKGAQGISCGRHLANHEVQIILFLPNFVKMLECITTELQLFSKTDGKQVASVKDFPADLGTVGDEHGGRCDSRRKRRRRRGTQGGWGPAARRLRLAQNWLKGHQDPLNKDLDSFDPIWPRRRVKDLRSWSASPGREETLHLLKPAQRLYYAPFDAASSPLPNGAVDIGPLGHLMARRQCSSSCLPHSRQVEYPLRSLSDRAGLGSFGVDLKVSLLDSGKKRAELVGRLKEAHHLLEEQTVQLRKCEGELSESRSKIEMLSLKQKQLENSISQLEGEKNLLELSHLEDQKNSGSLKDKILHLEIEMAKAKSSLDLISRGCEPMPKSPSRTLPLSKAEDPPEQDKESLKEELQSMQEALRVYQERAKVLQGERDKAGEDLRNVCEAQQAALVKTNEANQRLTDSLQAQTSLHEELNEMRLKYNKANLTRDLLAAKSERLEESVTNLKTKLEDVTSDKDRFFQEKLDLHKCVQHLTLELERALRGREGLDDQVADLHMELLSTKSQANKQEQEKVLLKEKLAATVQASEKLTAELGELRQTLGLRQEQLHHLQAEEKILMNRVEALEKERTQLVGEKETLLASVQVEGKAHKGELEALKADCEELRASEAQLKERSEYLEAELRRKIEEVAMVTLEQGHVAQQWKEKWHETACALKVKEKELQLAAVKQLTKKEKVELLGDCDIFAADLEELIELRTALARVTAEKAQLKRQQEESGRIIDLLQLQKDITGDSTLRGSSKISRSLESVHAELQKNRHQIHELEKEKAEMEMELKKLKLQGAPLVRVELDACRQELELERSRSQKLQHQVHDLKRASQLLEQSQLNQTAMSHKMQSTQSGLLLQDSSEQECGLHNDQNKDGSLNHPSFKQEDNEDRVDQPPNPYPSPNSTAEHLTQELVKQISSLQQELRDSQTTQRQQNAIIRGLREELEEANFNKPGEIKASLEEVDSELFQVREELQKVWDMLHMRDSKLEVQHQELESARGQFTECSSENQRLENLVATLKQQVTEKEQTLRQLERFRRTEKTEYEIKTSALELKLAEVEVLGEVQQEIPSEEHKSCVLQQCHRCDSFQEEMKAKVQGYRTRNSELRGEKAMALKSLNEAQVRTQGLQETVSLERKFTQTLEGENNDFTRRSQQLSEQLSCLAKEQEDLTKAYNELAKDRKGETSLEYWAPRSHLVQNVGEMLKSQEEQWRNQEEQNQRLKDGGACQNFQKLQEEMHRLQHQLCAKRQKMAAMACEMESLKHKNEDLMKAQARAQWQMENGQRVKEQSQTSSPAASGEEDERLASPWAAHSFQEFRPFNRRGRDRSPFQREVVALPLEAGAPSVRVGQSYLDAAFCGQGALGSEFAPQPEAWLSGIPASPRQPTRARTPDRSLSPLPLSRTPSPHRPNRPVSPLNLSKSSPDSPSGYQNEEEKSQGRTMPSAMKCSLLLSPRPFNMHRMNLNKKEQS
ncbi:early endosome antigen 1-like [Narcine bancroftii]|uniref:early endosome antigen 1-like n=1 Tax=Narcine bancroftii TaxID=1343680 RepID=UPI003831DE83